MYIRTLKPHEIEIRAQSVKEHGCVALLYKDARADMNVLDETFGVFGWKRDHEVINGNLFCNVSVWDIDNKQWITKQDVGVESNQQAEKGEASDSFKRACVNLGIGRELYTKIFIWINLNADETQKNRSGQGLMIKPQVGLKVTAIAYDENRAISGLEIQDSKGNVRFKYGNIKVEKVGKVKAQALEALAKRKGADIEAMVRHYRSSFEDMEIEVYSHAVRALEKREDVEG